MSPKIYVHGSYIGTTGYNNHTRDFFRGLSKYFKLKVRNFTVGDSWSGYSLNCHDGEPYINEIDKSILYKQVLWVASDKRDNFDIYPSNEKEFQHDFNIVLNETGHHLYYDGYTGPKIAYNVWESTRQPSEFFKKLLEFDEVWVPSKWQRDCTIQQGYDPNKIKVVPEGVDVNVFFPEDVELLDHYKDGRFKFLLLGRWDYRKSTKEVIETFLKTFNKDEPVDLIVSIDNMWGEKMDGFTTTEERLKHYGLNDERVKIIKFPSREDYVKLVKTGHVFVSCARSEGWNLPLIEAMACGTPSIYSNCSAQLEFAEGLGLPVKIIGEKPASDNNYGRYNMGNNLEGNYYEPDFDDLSRVMRFSYENYDSIKQKSLEESEIIRTNFNWDKVCEIGYNTAMDFYKKINSPEFLATKSKPKFLVTYLEGPKVEILGDILEEFSVEFLDENDNIIHSSKITTNMWTTCARKYYTKWKIRVNGEIINEFDLKGKTVLISFESKSIGDTIAWAPYVVEFGLKHQCNIVLSTFHNEWFENYEPYKNIKFVKPGSLVDCYTLYRIGYFRNDDGRYTKFDCYPNELNTIPLQQTASDILGLQFRELNLGIKYKPMSRPIQQKYVVLAPQSTAGCKEWVYENWCKLTEELIKKGYKVLTLTSSPYKIDNTTNHVNLPWSNIFNYLYHADLFIGLSSGLSWVNWALNKKTVMIAGFTEPFNEFITNNIRISNNLCVKCWNDNALVFDTGDWNWCPVYKGTHKQHICQKSITVDQVLKRLPI